MRALVVYESCFGNAEQIAKAVADGLRSREAEVEVTRSTEVTDLAGIDLLVVGSPTHAFGLPKSATRKLAEQQGGRPQETGITEWLDTLPPQSQRKVAAFATFAGGYFKTASNRIEKRLRRLSANVAAREDFRVVAAQGPLADGELERAQQWGASLAD